MQISVMTDWKHLQYLYPELLAYAKSISDTPEEAEDVVGDALERAATSSGKPTEERALKIWMFRVIKNLSIDELRKRRVRREYSADFKRLNSEASSVAGPEDMALVRQALGKLKPQEREVLCLVDVMGMKYAEAAEVMNVPVGTVMSRVSRARRALIDRVDADRRPAVPGKKLAE